MVQENDNSRLLIQLDKTFSSSFGICIVKGEVQNSPSSKVSGIFIKAITPRSAAHLSGKLNVGDRILTLNNRDVRNANEDDVIDIIKLAGQSIQLEIQRFGQKDIQKPSIGREKSIDVKKNNNNNISNISNNNNNNNNASNVQASPVTPQNNNNQTSGTDNAADEDDDDEEMQDTAGKMYSAGGMEIDRTSAANVKLSKSEKMADKETEDEFGYTTSKVKKKYNNMGNVHKTVINRTLNEDLGLALAGHKDRQKMACFIAGINPTGISAKADLKPGDEILEVNGIVITDRCHLNASVVFKNLPGGKIVLVVARRSSTQGTLSVKPVEHFPPVIDETEYLFTAYKNVRSIQIQKSGVAIGIMIIEGKHIEVGTGIFISDLQVGSPAEEAGLKVGELILAINKDVVVELSYEMVSGILKRCKGIVTLVICSLKSEADIAKEKAEEEKKLKAAAEPEKPKDPSVAEIATNKKTLIEIKPGKAPLGCIVVGGKNNLVKTGVTIAHIYPNGVFGKDNRLRVFDQILEFNSTPFDTTNPASGMTTLRVHQFFNLPYEKVTLMVWRNDPPETESITVDVMKKPGKEFGLTLAANNKGAVITEILPSGYVEIDTKLQRGDIISTLSGDSLEDLPLEVCYALLKGATGKISFGILRSKPSERK